MTVAAETNASLWSRTATLPSRAPLTSPIQADVCVVGAGIAGLTVAYLAARAGRSVVVIDSGDLVAGQTRYTSAHLSNVIDDLFTRTESLHGEKGSRLAAESHGAAIDLIEETSRREGIDCDFRRVDGYLFLDEGDDEKTLDDELAAARRAGLTGAEKIARAPIPGLESGPALRFPNQAEFHPLKYLAGLVPAIERDGGRVFTHTKIEAVEEHKDGVMLRAGDVEIRGDFAVVATNSPIIDRFALHTKLAPYSTYIVAGAMPQGTPHALLWDTHEFYRYVRLQTVRDEDGRSREFLISGGFDHKAGQADEDQRDRYGELEAWTRRRFPAMGPVEHRWMGQYFETLDGLAYIGHNPGSERVLIVTGDSGMGLTHGSLAGLLIEDLIAGRENPWATLYDPSRKTIKALPTFLEENLNVAAQYVDLVTGGDVASEDRIVPGQGAVLREGLKKIACYRDESGTTHRMSAICPHLGCVVQWNSAAATWDCPCHGSRFDARGKTINGPAISDLSPVQES